VNREQVTLVVGTWDGADDCVDCIETASPSIVATATDMGSKARPLGEEAG
jgi:hypothetical protein